MKRLLIAYLVFLSSAAVAEFAYDEKTNIFSSTGASQDVDQAAFNELCHVFVDPINLLNLKTHEIATLFAILRIDGTPVALRFIHDVEEMIKTARADFKSLENL